MKTTDVVLHIRSNGATINRCEQLTTMGKRCSRWSPVEVRTFADGDDENWKAICPHHLGDFVIAQR